MHASLHGNFVGKMLFQKIAPVIKKQGPRKDLPNFILDGEGSPCVLLHLSFRQIQKNRLTQVFPYRACPSMPAGICRADYRSTRAVIFKDAEMLHNKANLGGKVFREIEWIPHEASCKGLFRARRWQLCPHKSFYLLW